MDYVLLTIWVIAPLAFYLFALWSWLEQSTMVKKGKKRSQEPEDLFKQAVFLTVCSIVTYGLDLFILKGGAVDFLFTEWTPRPFFRLFLYPLVLYLGARSFGETKTPAIDKLPRPSEKYRNR